MATIPQVRQKTRQQLIWESMAGEEWAKQQAEWSDCRSPLEYLERLWLPIVTLFGIYAFAMVAYLLGA
jgi:hypothetical protein